jgi:pyruvate dehydrogenase E2 component (dihydrolipoamide acetyltransferase)
MSVSVSMPQLGESVTEGTVTRWLKKEGERVEADEPLLEVSTDKVDTEIPSPVSGVLRGITVAEDETVAVGAELAIIDEEGAAASAAPPAASAPAAAPAAEPEAPAPAAAPAAEAAAPAAEAPAVQAPPAPAPAASAPAAQAPAAANGYGASGYQEPYQQQAPPPAPAYQPQPPQQPQEPQQPAAEALAVAQPAPVQQAAPPQEPEQPAPVQQAAPPQEPEQPAPVQQAAPPQEPEQPAPVQQAAPPQEPQPAGTQQADGVGPQLTSGADGPYVTPLVRKLAAEHGIDLGTVPGTGVGGRIRKQDVLDAARERRGIQEPQPVAVPQQAGPPPEVPEQAAAPAAAAPAAAPAAPAPAAPAAAPAAAASAGTAPAADAGRPAIVPSSLRGRTEKLSRSRQVIAQRMVESLQTSAQLTTVVEADVTAIARLRDRAKAAFEAREGVKLSFLPFFALATVEALKVHPKLNAIIDTDSGQVTYHDAEHLGIAVDTERGLMVPVIRKAGDLNIAGLARKIADLAARTRAGQVSPDELSGGTFTLTNTGSRGALFDTPIINQPQVGILGTGTVVKRAVVVEDPALGEVIAVRSMVYLALTYDHRLVDGADAARFLVTIKERLEEGAFETELGL